MATNIAKLISATTHPGLLLAIFGYWLVQNYDKKFLFLGLLLLVLVPWAYAYGGTLLGVFNNTNLNQHERGWFYTITIVCFWVYMNALILQSAPWDLVKMSGLGTLACVLLSIANGFTKVSLHMFCTTGAMTILVSSDFGGLLFGLIPLVAWSRYQLKAHTVNQLILGTILGLMFGVSGILIIS